MDRIKYWIRPDIKNRIKQGSIAARFESRVVEITESSVVIEAPEGREELGADAVFLLTGYHPDRSCSGTSGCASTASC